MEVTFIFFFASVVMALPYFLLGGYDDHILDLALHCDNIPHNGSPGTGGEMDYKNEKTRRINCLMHAKWAIDDDDEKLLKGEAVPETQEVPTEDFDRSGAIDIEVDVVETTEQLKLETEQVHYNNINDTNQVNDVQYNTWKKIEAMKARIEQLQQQLNNKNYGNINN